MAFPSGGYGRHREMEEFFALAVSGGTGVNGLNIAEPQNLAAIFTVTQCTQATPE